MRIAFFLHGSPPDGLRPRLGPVTAEVVERIRGAGAHVDLVVPEASARPIAELRPGHDLYVLKSKTPLSLSLAAALELRGADVVNGARASALARDKITATAVLAGAGIPVPPSWATGRVTELRPLLAAGPLWLKDPRGSRGSGVRRVERVTDLDGLSDPTDAHGLPLALFAQREVPSAGGDLKAYVVDRRVWGVTRAFPARSDVEKAGTPAVLPEPVRAAALACGRALGLEVYGVDFLLTAERFHAVDVNAFPGFRGAAGAAERIAGHLLERANRAARGSRAAMRGRDA